MACHLVTISPKTNAAEANCREGFKNCTNPTVDMRTRRAAKLNNTKGPAVSGPEIASKTWVPISFPPPAPVPLSTIHAIAKGASNSTSDVTETTGPSGNCFLIIP